MNSPLACPSCRTLFAIPPGMDHFALMGVPRFYDIDTTRLQAVYRAVGRTVHPDRFAGQNDATTTLAVSLSAALNEAYNTLSDPRCRADYLLTLAGGPSAMDERGVPGTLLAEVMMLREEIDAARENNDRATLERMRGELSERRKRSLAIVAQLAGVIDQATETQRHELRRQLNSLKYIDNLLAQTQNDAPVQQL